MKLSALTSKTATVDMPFGEPGDKLTIRPNAISNNFLTDLASLDAPVVTPEDVMMLVEKATHLVCDLILAWDLVDEDGRPIPVDAESIEQYEVPFAFLVASLRAGTSSLGEAPAPTSGATSDGTSSRVVKLERSRTGTR